MSRSSGAPAALIAIDVPHVLGVGLREHVGAVVAGDEEEIVALFAFLFIKVMDSLVAIRYIQVYSLLSALKDLMFRNTFMNVF